MPKANVEVVTMQDPSIADIQARYAGLWVAVKNGDVVATRGTPDALVLALRDRNIHGATILRCPGDDEAELVGLG